MVKFYTETTGIWMNDRDKLTWNEGPLEVLKIEDEAKKNPIKSFHSPVKKRWVSKEGINK